ncbi:MAG: exosortase/archaeosortase family protein [Ignavibacteriota bacterium]
MLSLPDDSATCYLDGARGAFLQHGSATVAFRILQASGMPVLRHGMQFSLPGLDFEVAPECSGIHSSVALLMVALVAGYLCLRSGWSRLVLLFLTVPIALIKNATRIVAITTLSVRVDRSFIDGPFHHRYGGAIFSTVAVVLFVLVLAGLQRLERGRPLGSAHPIGPRSDTVVQVNPAPSATGTTSS